ncbi:metallophosphoesterase [Sphingobacterium faecium]|uniref:metallophosphoesterase n=1 Tax=Sphingobacterium faecium TaxID=34087 RepID=UPI0021B5823C|nr:metallophosphoesterase [Sphingobacterium faecium]UXD71084.1 metallophosphoesterase [Sphingobacterium faecium]
MDNIILHISDLHVSLEKDFDGSDIKFDSFLVASDSDSSSLFIEKFSDFAKAELSNKIIYLLITGDITNRGEIKEFEFAEKYLEILVSRLNVAKERILLIPGDHDLNRREIQNLISNNPDSLLEDINDAKFSNFKKFYKNFLNKDFDPNLVIVDSLIIAGKIQLIGINSSYKIDLQQKLGLISIEKFEEEFRKIDKEGLKNILCAHHNLLSAHEDKKSGQWEVSNRARLLSKLVEKSINFVFSGNEHTSSLEKYAQGEITISDSGPLTSKRHDTAFKIYDVIIDDNIALNNHIYGLVKTGSFDNPYHWEKRNNIHCKQDDKFQIYSKDNPKIDEQITELTSDTLGRSNSVVEIEVFERKIYYNAKFTDVLYEKIKELKAFHSGHFHWSETSRAHNWIDISKLIESRDNLNFLKDAIVDVIESQIESENIDLIIGLGYEGNILATKAAIKYNKPYSFLPYSYRHDEHHKFETELNFNNDSGEFKNVLIITDVVNDGRTIRKLINKRQNKFFSNVQKKYVISLFYTGESNISQDILNFSFIKSIPDYDLVTDEEVNDIEFYAVRSLKVDKCPYGKDFREECLIYKDNLSCVNLFYDERKYLQNG